MEKGHKDDTAEGKYVGSTNLFEFLLKNGGNFVGFLVLHSEEGPNMFEN